MHVKHKHERDRYPLANGYVAYSELESETAPPNKQTHHEDGTDTDIPSSSSTVWQLVQQKTDKDSAQNSTKTVQHSDQGTGSSVELSHVQCSLLPRKTLVNDQKDSAINGFLIEHSRMRRNSWTQRT